MYDMKQIAFNELANKWILFFSLGLMVAVMALGFLIVVRGGSKAKAEPVIKVRVDQCVVCKSKVTSFP